ncbi:hypothetical protein HMPREF1399_01653, partial [Helicobacter pylori GAM118Bi]
KNERIFRVLIIRNQKLRFSSFLEIVDFLFKALTLSVVLFSF